MALIKIQDAPEPFLPHIVINSGKSTIISRSVKTSIGSLGVQNASNAFRHSPPSTRQSDAIFVNTLFVSARLNPAQSNFVSSPCISTIKLTTATVGFPSDALPFGGTYSFSNLHASLSAHRLYVLSAFATSSHRFPSTAECCCLDGHCAQAPRALEAKRGGERDTPHQKCARGCFEPEQLQA